MEVTSIGIEAIAGFLPVIFFSILAFWKENHILFLITSGIAMITGLYAPDILNGNYVTTNLGIAVGLGMIAYYFLCIGMALRLMFWSSEANA